MTRDEFIHEWGSFAGVGTETERALRRDIDALIQTVRAETRATALAEEDRRVWCEGWMRAGLLEPPQRAQKANWWLNRYREARAAWDARGEKG